MSRTGAAERWRTSVSCATVRLPHFTILHSPIIVAAFALTPWLLNFQNITYLSSAALSELLRINQTAKVEKAAVQLCGLSKEIHKVFEITKLVDVFHVEADEEVEKTIMRLNHDAEWEVYEG